MPRFNVCAIATVIGLLFAGQCAAQSTPKPPALRIIKAAIAENLKDPESARFRNIERVDKPDASIDGIYCGEVNAKNSYGGYIGYLPFMIAILGGQPFVMAQAGDSDEAEGVRTVCAENKAERDAGNHP